MLLINAGDQVPVIPLIDVAGNTGEAVPEQIGAIVAKVGVTPGIIVISNVDTAVAHCPAAGVKVYVEVPVTVVLMVAGLQVPVMPLFDVAGNTGATAFTQSGPMIVNTGEICASIVILIVAVPAH